MIWIRSFLFNVAFYGWLGFVLLFYLWWFLPFERMHLQRAVGWWARTQFPLLRFFAGIDCRVLGRENIPKGGALFVSKHQSAWDTFIFYALLRDVNYVLKQELTKIPVWGTYARKCEAISIDRNAGAKALKGLVRDCVDRISKGRQVILFPEGTRTHPGQKLPYQPGVAAVYRALPAGTPVIPVALNSGDHWGRKSFLKYPGTITIEFLPPIPTGLDRQSFMHRIETEIETAVARLAETPSGES
ncbi:MAG: lysophospholipid acyltransferase family protein [Proteobacteria bacterium]|nr:lysophospholipid acyltransferase family protein [Pseudomonadota bacterium]